MPYIERQLQPGVNTQLTKWGATSTWNSSNLIRFKDGLLQKLGGCQHINTTPFIGDCHALLPFEDLANNTYCAIGTDQRLQIFNNGSVTDITPYRTTTTPSGPFTTVINTPNVTVTDAGHGAVAGDWVYITGGSAVGGLTLSGYYQVAAPVATNTYVIVASSNATSSTTGGGTPSIHYLISLQNSQPPGGYNTGYYGLGVFGVGSAATTTVTQRSWSLDNWGQDLVGCYTNGPAYVWIPPISAGNVATLITGTDVPLYMTGLFVAMPERQIMAYGAEGGGTQDPLLIRWCDVGDYTSWTATATNQAGSFRISSGSAIIGGLQFSQSALFFTDIELWSAQYLGFPLVWGFNKIGIGCGLVAQRAVAKLGPTVFWMSQQGFFSYNGSSVEPLRCTVWDFVFNNIDLSSTDDIFAAANSAFNEIWWFFPTIGSGGAVTSYVKYNTLDGVWDYGSLARSAWVDQSILGPPIGADYNGLLQQHETANDLDGTAMASWANSGWFAISDGDNTIYLERFLPDFIFNSGGSVTLTIETVNYVGDTPQIWGPYTVTSATEFVIVRARARLMSIRIDSTGILGNFWRNGKSVYSSAPAGRLAR